MTSTTPQVKLPWPNISPDANRAFHVGGTHDWLSGQSSRFRRPNAVVRRCCKQLARLISCLMRDSCLHVLSGCHSFTESWARWREAQNWRIRLSLPLLLIDLPQSDSWIVPSHSSHTSCRPCTLYYFKVTTFSRGLRRQGGMTAPKEIFPRTASLSRAYITR